MDDTLRDTLFASNKQFRTPKHLVVDQVFDTSRINHSKYKNSKHVTFIRRNKYCITLLRLNTFF